MPIYEPPRTDVDRLAFLDRAAATGAADASAGNHYVSGDTLGAVMGFLGEYAPAVSVVSEKSSERSREVRESVEAVRRVEVCLRDMWEVVKRRANREGEPAEVLTYYRLGLDGTVPKPSGREALMTLAGQVVEGDAAAVSNRFPAMINPSAAELGERLHQARAEIGDVAGADRALDEAQETAAALRERADDLIDDVMAELRFNLRKKDPASRRRIMRTYGARFAQLKGEPTDPDAATETSQA